MELHGHLNTARSPQYDSAMSDTSMNAVANSVIKQYIDGGGVVSRIDYATAKAAGEVNVLLDNTNSKVIVRFKIADFADISHPVYTPDNLIFSSIAKCFPAVNYEKNYSGNNSFGFNSLFGEPGSNKSAFKMGEIVYQKADDYLFGQVEHIIFEDYTALGEELVTSWACDVCAKDMNSLAVNVTNPCLALDFKLEVPPSILNEMYSILTYPDIDENYNEHLIIKYTPALEGLYNE